VRTAQDMTPALSFQQFSLALKASLLSPASCTNLFQRDKPIVSLSGLQVNAWASVR
jgi:hypothetical protein